MSELTQDQKNRAEILKQLDDAITRLKKRIAALSLESESIILNPFAQRMIATAPDGSLFVAINVSEDPKKVILGFQYAPLAKVTKIVSFKPEDEHYVATMTKDLERIPEADRLKDLKIVSLREFSSKLADVLKQALTETEQLKQNINDNGNSTTTGTDIQPEQGTV